MHRGLKIALGILCLIVGIIALFTPFTPGSWLIFVGAELLGIRMIIKARRKVTKAAGSVADTVKEAVTGKR